MFINFKGGNRMKKLRTYVIGTLAFFMLAACQQGEQNATEPQETEVTENGSENGETEVEGNDSEGAETESDTPSETENTKVFLTAKKIESYPVSLYDRTEFDLDDDGEDEIIELHVNAEQAEDGEYDWDDGQNWLLVVKDGDQTYPLFDGWVQIGKLSFSLLKSGEKPMLILLKTGTAEFALQRFTYNKEENGYIQETIYSPEDVNFWYQSK
jgi:hypothetical protein